MTLVSLLIALVIIGAVLYLLQLVPMDATVKCIIYVIATVVLIVWLLDQLPAFLP